MNQKTNPVQIAQEDFKRDRYAIVRGFLPPLLAQFAHRYAIMRTASGLMDTNDAQMPGTPSAYADTFMETLMELSLPHVAQVAERELYPTWPPPPLRKNNLISP